MEEKVSKRQVVRVESGSGIFWCIGWLFTVGFIGLTGWKIFFALFIWPYYLGLVLK